MTIQDFRLEIKNWKFSKYKLINFIIGVSALLLYEFAGRPYYRPYIYSHNINDLHIADTLGNSLGTIATIFILVSLLTSETVKGNFLIRIITVAVALYEIAHPLLGKPIDIWDIVATIVSGVISFFLFNFIFKPELNSKNLQQNIQIKRTSSENIDFIKLVKQLDADLAERDGDDHSFYAQFNKIDAIKYAVVAYENGIPAGCGALKEFDPGKMEVKRMYVIPGKRGKGIAAEILAALENWAAELSYTTCILETGKKQPEAIHLYKKNGYSLIPNYGQYADIENSICFEKKLI